MIYILIYLSIKEIMELFLQAGQSYAFLLELIIHYLKLDERKKVNLIHLSPGALIAARTKKLPLEVPSLVTSDGHVETQIFQICKRLFEVLPQWKAFFLGEGEESTEIAGIKTQLKDGKQLRKHLQKHLQNRTFFVSNHITFADFYMFTQLYDNLIDLTDEQKSQYNNLFRWYKHVQNLPQVREYLTLTKRFLVQDPLPKHAFLAEKKKPKKEKEQKDEKKPEEHQKEEKKAGEKKEKKEEKPQPETKEEQPQPKVEQPAKPQPEPAASTQVKKE